MKPAAAIGLGVVSLLILISSPVLADEDDTKEEDKKDGCPAPEQTTENDSEKSGKPPAGQDKTTCSAARCSCRHRCGCKKPEIELSVTGIRPSLTSVSSPGTRQTSDIGVAFAGTVDSYALDGSAHGQMQWVLGGGQAGFEGMLAGVIEGGYRADFTKNQGLFGRAGFDGRLQGNDRLYFSALELPRISLGYQFLTGRTVLEIGARSGPILTGRFNPGDSGIRSLSGSFEYGGFASAQFDFLRLDATALRIDARKTGDHTPVDVGRASLCGIGGKVGICADFSVFRGTANMGNGADGAPLGFRDVLATYAGVTFGLAKW